MIRVVPDTNILISSIFWRGKPYEVIKGGIEGKHVLITSREIVEELAERLKNKFSLPESDILLFMDIISAHFHIVPKISAFSACADPKDNKILETAFDGKADFIVTGDSHLLVLREFKGIKIMAAEEFLKRLAGT
jgi:putative PIN family toxin of toxin-antitoxin system